MGKAPQTVGPQPELGRGRGSQIGEWPAGTTNACFLGSVFPRLKVALLENTEYLPPTTGMA